jgi:polysaccharide biosynthesis/export protein
MRRSAEWQKTRTAVGIMVVAMAISLIGCGSRAPSAPKMTHTVFETTAELRLAAGDVVEIKFPYAVQFNEEQTVMPNGRIVMPLVGEVLAAGKTPARLRDELIDLHSKHLQHPELAVIVRSFFGNRVFVGGEVNNPGVIELPGRLTVLQAITQAGGFNMNMAQPANVIVIRPQMDTWETYALNLKGVLGGDEGPEPFYLQPRDIIHVPRTTIANVNQWVDQHIYRLLPIGRVGMGVNVNP